MMSGDRLVSAGGVVTSLGGTLGVAFFIYSLQATLNFWSWPGWCSFGLVAVGLVIIGIGLLSRDKVSVGQRQRAGGSSKNYQAGRDINIRRREGNGD